MQRTHTVLSATAFAVIACAAANARAEDTVTLKFAMAVPPSHYTAVQGGKFFMDRATELSKGRIKFEWYPAEQLGKAKDLLALVQTGVADMADVVPGYVPDKLPLSGVSELPGQITSSCEGTRVFYALTRPGEFLAKNEYDAQKVHVLMAAPLVPYKIFTSKKELDKPEDIQGLKLRSAGGASDIALTQLGAVSIRLAGPDIHESLTRGTIDGAMYPYLSLKSFDLVGSIKFATEGVGVGSVATAFLISAEKWKAIPDDLKKDMDQAGQEAGMNYCAYMDREELAEQKVLSSSIKATRPSDADLERWRVLLAGVKSEWAKRLDSRRKPGTEALQAWDVEMAKVRGSDKTAPAPGH
ncbi:MAG: C4-dicarboxylate ABC transporter [Bradyrhizobium sp.]|uniref:TRAP transporter substrate-binding protein n=1 Tax=Bradyrhizobium sp. TaxID=376 RepID=UPI001203D153|nr:TRAP transporter substrate-binding protein DctP [Bradyrhizobium sp.]THD63173.1 MAG: C4-dicarboxylate ABC transporter [Bradyrhizobium sp.]